MSVRFEAFHQTGALRLDGLMIDQLAGLLGLATNGPGARIEIGALAHLLTPVSGVAELHVGDRARPVRAVLFDKTVDENWALGWHQDRTIVVQSRRDVPGFGPWSTKQGLLHVAPPMAILEGMATFRIHLDPCGPENAPLKVALGSHRIGRVSAREAASKAAGFPMLICEAAAGDVWAYSTPVLHASDRAEKPTHRRVLQVDYAAIDLPGGLAWAS